MKRNLLLLSAFLMSMSVVSCSKELDLAHKYDNTESSKPAGSVSGGDEEKKDDDKDEDDGLNYSDATKWLISDRYDVDVKSGIPRKGYWLDGKISAGKFFGSDKFTIFWSSDASLMQTDCATPWLEDNINNLTNKDVVIGKTVNPTPGFSDGGQWFIGVHELAGGKLAGFFHSESHFSGKPDAYKSIGVAYSTDKGKTWTAGEKILSGTDPKPATAVGDGRSYGLGDGCVVWNDARKSWICYYSGYCPDKSDFVITMAESKDPEGKPGTWKKWDGAEFTAEGCDTSTGLGGENHSIAKLSTFHGGNPSVMYNTYLKKWTMVYHSWQRAIIYSESEDGITWDTPVNMVSLSKEPGGSMYPNLISSEGDLTGGQKVRLYYASDMVNGVRKLSVRKIQFK